VRQIQATNVEDWPQRPCHCAGVTPGVPLFHFRAARWTCCRHLLPFGRRDDLVLGFRKRVLQSAAKRGKPFSFSGLMDDLQLAAKRSGNAGYETWSYPASLRPTEAGERVSRAAASRLVYFRQNCYWPICRLVRFSC
jgi:hypothetical protein